MAENAPRPEQLFPGLEADAFGERLGLVWDRIDGDAVAAHLEVGAAHRQPYGFVHGGVHASVVEDLASLGGLARVWHDGCIVVGVANQTDLLRRHREGRLDAVAEPVHVGRSQQLWEVRITRPEDGKLVARGQLRLQVVGRSEAR